MNTSKELIYYNPFQTGKKENFSGAYSPVSAEFRKEYLSRYVKTLKEQYALSDLPEKVVGDEEVQKLVQKYGFSDQDTPYLLHINEMEAFERNAPVLYENWKLYTLAAKVEDGALCFTDGTTPPVPAAKFTFDGASRVQKLVFSFRMEKFTRAQRAGIVNVRGRFFELRAGLQTVVKLHLLSDGQLYILDGSKTFTHPSSKLIGMAKENEWNTLSLCMGKESCSLSLNGETAGEEYPLYNGLNPDTFFVYGGMHPIGEWGVRPELLQTEGQTITEFFLPAKAQQITETPLGNVKLPYAIGTHEHKDKELVLRAKFDYHGEKHVKLNLKSIDPCGYVYINGKLVLTASDFLAKTLDIASYLQEKDNLLEIVVCPRAPEVFYQWHRHTDPYNGWFFRGGFLEFYNEHYAHDLCVITEEVQENGAKIKFSATISGGGVARILLKKVYPDVGEEREIDSFAYFGKETVCTHYDLEADLWSPETPNVYEIIVRLETETGVAFEKRMETGFRTIVQENGEFHLNGKRILLNGALAMQFLPPYKEIPINHVCPSDAQIVTELEQIKRMSGNTLRLHLLGYGSNDERFARFADRAGCLLIWTTRLIDSIETTYMIDDWYMSEAFAAQIKEVRQYPSIIMWEGSNEARVSLAVTDCMYDQFVDAVKSVDTTRLICPCSHLYYGGGIYSSKPEMGYYQDDGKANQLFEPVKSSYGWVDKDVVRSSHTYQILLGYGGEWENFRTQNWASQKALLESKTHAYVVTEYAIIGRACPFVPEAKDYFNPKSYELGNEDMLGFAITDEEYELSQAHQALCTLYTNKKMRMLDVDGMMWCCLQSGANDASYLKPIIDFYGYAKFAFYILKDYYRNNYCTIDCDGPFWGAESTLRPVLISEEGAYRVRVQVLDEWKNVVYNKVYEAQATSWQTPLGVCDLKLEKEGYYTIQTEVEKL